VLSVDDARARLARLAGRLPSEPTPLEVAAGLVLAGEVVAGRDVPGFDNSAMDGFAVRLADLADAARERPARLRLVGEAAAGAGFEGQVEPGTAVRIMTGAPIPPGAEAVIEVEETEADGDHVLVFRAVEAKRSFRAAGSDIAAGAPALAAGTHLGPAQLGLLAALGVARPECHRRARVAVLATGDELVDAGVEPGPGQVVDIASPALAAALAEVGAEVVPVARAADRREAIREALGVAAAAADLVLSVGGVSMGERDLVRPVVEEIGELDFWRVAMRPGKPLAVGRVGRTPFIGLPGNPVSALVGFEVFVLPTIMSMSHRDGWGRPVRRARLSTPLSTPEGLRTFARGVASGDGAELAVEPLAGQGSHQLATLARANVLLDVPEDRGDMAAGDCVDAILIDQAPGPRLGR
jgi:molybdopterin molybdotransferase